MLLPAKLESFDVQVIPSGDEANFPELPTAMYSLTPLDVTALMLVVPKVLFATCSQEAGTKGTGRVAFIAWVAISTLHRQVST
jgi:hypothetical protein